MQELWKEIENTNSRYLISDRGRVWSRYLEDRGADPIMRVYLTKGYAKLNIQYSNGKRAMRVHRLVALAFLPNPDNLPEVNHIDGNKSNNMLSNLEWSSPEDNQAHYNTSPKALYYQELAGNQVRRVEAICLETGEIFNFGSITAARKAIGSMNPKPVVPEGYKLLNGYAYKYLPKD